MPSTSGCRSASRDPPARGPGPGDAHQAPQRHRPSGRRPQLRGRGRRDRRDRRGVGLRQDDGGDVDHATAAAGRAHRRRRGPPRRARPREAPRLRDPQGPRQRHRDDLPGPDDVPEPDDDDREADLRGRQDPSRRHRRAGRRAGGGGARPGRPAPPQGARSRLSPPAVGRAPPARDDRDGAFLRPEAADRRRADDGARRHDPGADPEPARPDQARTRDGHDPDHPRHGGDRRPRRPRGRDVRRPQGGDGGDGRSLQEHPSSVHRGAAGVDSPHRPGSRPGALLDSGDPAGPAQPARRLPLRATVRVRDRPVPRAGSTARRP